MTSIRPCPHREILAGHLASTSEIAAWAAKIEALPPCRDCAAPVTHHPIADLPPLPSEVAIALTAGGCDGAKLAQATLDALAVPEALYPAIAARLAAQPGTCVKWRAWWSSWRRGALVIAAGN